MPKRVPHAKLVISAPGIRIYEGLAEKWNGDEKIDIVMTNPYGPLPKSLAEKPMIIHQWAHRKDEAERWCHNKLNFEIGVWNKGQEAFWCANIEQPAMVDISAYWPEPGGWWPEHMTRMIVQHFIQPGQVVWDGFMGRGTLAKICRERGIHYVGVEQLPTHIAKAREYLGL